MPQYQSYNTQRNEVVQNATVNTSSAANVTAQNVTLVQQQEELSEEKVLPKSSPTGGQIDLGGDESEESLIQSDVSQNTTVNKTKEFEEKNDDIQRKIDML